VSAAQAAAPEVDAELRARLAAVVDEGQEIWERFDLEVRQNAWHPFVAADYERVLRTLVEMRAPGLRFLEWGSATGIITIMADLLGYEAYGIELDGALVRTARGLAEKFGSEARFAEGSFIPTGYRWKARDGDDRLATIGDGASGYLELRHPLDDFDIVYAFPWNGEEPMMRDLMKTYGARDACLLLNSATTGVRTFRHGKEQP
jgi:hypothetical protein